MCCVLPNELSVVAHTLPAVVPGAVKYILSCWLSSYFSVKQFAQIFRDGTKEEKISKQIFSQSDLNHDLN